MIKPVKCILLVLAVWLCMPPLEGQQTPNQPTQPADSAQQTRTSDMGPPAGPAPIPGPYGDIYSIGGSVRPPVLVYAQDPEFSKEARRDKISGNVVVQLIVDKDGKPRKVHVLRSLRPDLDQKAVEAVQRYKFKPAMNNGVPVAVHLNVSVNFQIF